MSGSRPVADDPRVITIYNDELADPVEAYYASWRVMSYMLFPDDVVDREKYMVGFDQMQKMKDITNFIRKLSPELPEMTWKDNEYTETYKRASYSRQSGLLGSRAIRGSMSGLILKHLLKLETLEAAYEAVIDSIQGASPESLRLPDDTQLATPSSSQLEQVWRNYGYRNVSHLWAAEYDIKKLDQKQFDLQLFCEIAAYYRDALVKATKANRKELIIKAPSLVWELLQENKKPFDAPTTKK